MPEPYRRKRGVIFRPWIWGASRRGGINTVLDAGQDAPLSPRGRFIFRAAILVVLALGLALIALTIHSR